MILIEIAIDSLIAPCDGDSAVGVDLRATAEPDNAYQLMKEARHAARRAEKQYFDGQNLDQSIVYWQAVAEYGIAILRSSSKDIDVLAWLTEALLRLYGFAGLSYGFELTLLCFQQYGLALYPEPPADESREWQVKALTAWNGDVSEGTLILPMRLLSITNPASYALWQYQHAVEIDGLTDATERNNHLQQGAVLLEDFMHALYATPLDTLLTMQEHIEKAQQHFNQLTQFLCQLLQDAAPPFDRITNALKEYHENLSHLIIMHQQYHSINTKKNMIYVVDDLSKKQDKELRNLSHCYTRASALREIENIALFIQNTEPQSPLPFMLKRALKWAKLPLPELLTKMIQDKTALERVGDLIGIDTQSHSQEE